MKREVIQGALENVLSTIENLDKKSVLDVFAREGDWNSYLIYNRCQKMECWEIDSAFEKKLKENLPNAKIKILDSMKTINTYKRNKKYDVVFIDNSLGIYGKNQYCEHFNFIKNTKRLVNKGGYLIFNVSVKPFKGKNYKEYENQRKFFYKTSETTLDYLIQFYKDLFGINSSDLITIFPREKFNFKIYLYFFLVKIV